MQGLEQCGSRKCISRAQMTSSFGNVARFCSALPFHPFHTIYRDIVRSLWFIVLMATYSEAPARHTDKACLVRREGT